MHDVLSGPAGRHTSDAPAGTACIGSAEQELWPRGQDVGVVACRTLCRDASVDGVVAATMQTGAKRRDYIY